MRKKTYKLEKQMNQSNDCAKNESNKKVQNTEVCKLYLRIPEKKKKLNKNSSWLEFVCLTNDLSESAIKKFVRRNSARECILFQ